MPIEFLEEMPKRGRAYLAYAPTADGKERFLGPLTAVMRTQVGFNRVFRRFLPAASVEGLHVIARAALIEFWGPDGAVLLTLRQA